MEIRKLTVDQVAKLMGFASLEEAKFMLADLFASGYGDTDDIPEDVRDKMISSARFEARQYSEEVLTPDS